MIEQTPSISYIGVVLKIKLTLRKLLYIQHFGILLSLL